MTHVPVGLNESIDGETGAVVWTFCNDARRNAVTPAMLGYIASRCASLRGEVVVLTGAGPAVFCSGFDLTALRDAPADPERLPDAPLIEAADAMERADATFIASINGATIGAGVELVSACDLRVAVKTASFRIPAAKLGVVYHARGVQRIRAAFGTTLCARMLLLGETVTADVAQSAFATATVVPARSLQAVTAGLVCALQEGRRQSIAGNRALLRALDGGLPSADFLRIHQARRVAAYRVLERAGAPPHPVRRHTDCPDDAGPEPDDAGSEPDDAGSK